MAPAVVTREIAAYLAVVERLRHLPLWLNAAINRTFYWALERIRERLYRSGNHRTTVSALKYLSRLTSQAEFQQEADRIVGMIGDNSAQGILGRDAISRSIHASLAAGELPPADSIDKLQVSLKDFKACDNVLTQIKDLLRIALVRECQGEKLSDAESQELVALMDQVEGSNLRCTYDAIKQRLAL